MSLSLLGLGSAAELIIEIADAESRKKVEVKNEKNQKVKRLLYTEGDSVTGKVLVNLKDKRLEHTGIKVEFLGVVELFYDRGNHHEFTSQIVELAPAGVLVKSGSYDFAFNEVHMPYESYNGLNARLRYFVRVTISKRFGDIVQEKDIWVHKYTTMPEINHSIKMEVGIEGALHIEFEYNRSKYSLRDVIVGKIYFLLVRIKIQRMEVSIIKRETTGSGANSYNESETVTKFEIMDGSPVRGECIPVRLFLNGFELTPTFKDVNKKFSVRYYLNLVLIDQEDRRYFKQQEITLWRQANSGANSYGASMPSADPPRSGLKVQ